MRCSSAWTTVESSLGGLARQEITAAQFAGLAELRGEIVPPAEEFDPLTRSDLEQDLADWLSRAGVEDAWSLAGPLAAAGVDLEPGRRAAALLEGGALGPAMTWISASTTVSTLLTEIKESVRRISELVAAVRSYSQMDRASMQQTDLAAGLDSTLVMLGHRLRDGVSVVRDYDPGVPIIPAYAGELNQVWTNLIDNAIDAMDGHGTLRISTPAGRRRRVVRSATPGRACPRRSRPARSTPSTRPRRSARAPGSGWTSPSGSSSTDHRGDICDRVEDRKTVHHVQPPSLELNSF